MPHELPILGNFKKIPEMLGFDGEYPAVQPKTRFWRVLVKMRKKSAVKHSIEKPNLLNFVNMSPTFCPRLESKHVLSNSKKVLLHIRKNTFYENATTFETGPTLTLNGIR